MATMKGFTASYAVVMQKIFDLMENDPVSAVYKDILVAAIDGEEDVICYIQGLSEYLAARTSLKENGFQVVKLDQDENDLISFKVNW